MTDANFPLTADSDFDDLPRTLRREKEARARAAREAKERHERSGRAMDASYVDPPSYLAHARGAPVLYGDEPVPAVVRRFDVPFFRLVFFFLKAALAAIPALMLLGVILYFAGKGLETYYPDLIRMKIMIVFPGG
jgi:hypothetical protein